MSLPVYIVDIIGEVVQAASAKVLASIQANELAALGVNTITAVNYQKGHKLELIETLLQMSGHRTTEPLKYPCIYLVQDFQEVMNPRAGIFQHH